MSAPYYHVQFTHQVNGLSVAIPAWQFRCRAVDPRDPNCIKVDLPAVTLQFTQDALEKTALLYVTPIFDGQDNYYLDEYALDAQLPTPPTEEFAPGIIPIPVLIVRVPKAGDSGTLVVTANLMDSGYVPPPEFATTPLGKVRDYPMNSIAPGWERLDVQKHAAAFPVQGLWQLPEGNVWCIEAPTPGGVP